MSSCCVVGLGYIGLPTAAVLAKAGHRVIGVDVNAQVVATVNEGRIHIVEPDLDQAVAAAVACGSLSAQLTPAPADVFMIAVPTPFRNGADGIPQPNIDYVLAAARAIAPVLRHGNLVLLESTSPVGTTEQVAQVIAEASGLSSEQLHIAYCPERVLPGRILQELISNDRVIGGLTPAAAAAGKAFYASFCQGELLATTARTAELVKLTENSFRDVNIAFANELSLVCDHLAINVRELIRLANHHPRVNVLQPGCGVATTDTINICPAPSASLARAISSRQKSGSSEGMPKHTAELISAGSSGSTSVAYTGPSPASACTNTQLGIG